MKRSGMLRPTSCTPSPVTNANNETESNEDTEPRHCTNLFLAAVPFTALKVNVRLVNDFIIKVFENSVVSLKSSLYNFVDCFFW